MQYIQDELNGVGKVTFVESTRDTRDDSTYQTTLTEEISNVVADPSQCIITLHFREWEGSSTKPAQDKKNAGVDLVSVKSIVVEPIQQDATEINAATGTPNLVVFATKPTVSALLVRWRDTSTMFPFIDAGLANTVANAMKHAVKLCGGAGQ